MKIFRKEYINEACEILESIGFEVIDFGDVSLYLEVELETGMGKTIIGDKNGNMVGCIIFRKKANIKEWEVMINLMKLQIGILLF